MDKKIFTTRVRTNLSGVLQMTQTIEGIMMTGDNAANQIIVELYDENGKVEIANSEGTKIYGYFIRGDGYTVEVPGEVEDGNAKVIVPEVVYAVSGTVSIAVRLLEGPHTVIDGDISYIAWDTKMCIAALSCYIQTTETNSLIDPTHHIPDVQELLEYIDVLNQERALITEEEGLRVLAESGRVTAEEARVAAEQERVNAESERVSAESEREAAETARETSEGERETAEAARETSEGERETAETARETAEAARETAQAERNAKIDGMTVAAVELNPYSAPTATITEVSGHKHIIFGLSPGDPFVIARTFASVAEMETYSGTDVRVGQFVIIASTVEDPDNAKMYVKTSNGWSFVTDLSGAQGIQGPRGFTGNGISSTVLNQDYTLTIYFTDGDSYTTPNPIRGIQGETGNGIALIEFNDDYSLTITMDDGISYTTNPIRGETGATGETGNGIANIIRNADYTLTIVMTDGTSYTTPPIKGEPGAAGTEFTYDSEDQSLLITYY